MLDGLLALIVDEGKWFPFSMAVALAASAIVFYSGAARLPLRSRILAAMNLFGGMLIGTMAFGHLLAVTVKLSIGTLREGSLLIFYAIGVILAVPAAAVVGHTRAIIREHAGQRVVALNAWLATSLIVLGLPNLPLTVPALLTIGYHLHSRRATGWAIVSAAVVINVGLFVAAMFFLLSGQTFEQFSGIE